MATKKVPRLRMRIDPIGKRFKFSIVDTKGNVQAASEPFDSEARCRKGAISFAATAGELVAINPDEIPMKRKPAKKKKTSS